MKIQQLLATPLLSVLLLSPLYAQDSNLVDSNYIDEKARTEQLLLAEQYIIRDFKEDITYLLRTRDKKRIEPNVFGDCIHFYLSTEDSKTIAAEKVIPKIHLLFDTDFMTNLEHLRIGDNLLILDENQAHYSNEDEEYKSTIRIIVREKDSEYDSAKTYWFYKRDGHWIFVGMTCIG